MILAGPIGLSVLRKSAGEGQRGGGEEGSSKELEGQKRDRKGIINYFHMICILIVWIRKLNFSIQIHF